MRPNPTARYLEGRKNGFLAIVASPMSAWREENMFIMLHVFFLRVPCLMELIHRPSPPPPPPPHVALRQCSVVISKNFVLRTGGRKR